MKIMIVIFSIVVFNYSSYAQSSNIELDSITIEKFDESGNSFSFTFSYEDFDTSRYDLSKIKDGLIDGSEFFGTDGSIPHKQIKDFILTINGQNIEIGKSVYSSFFNPNIGYIGGPMYLDAFFGKKDPNSVFVFMSGSDGAGTYSVVWLFSKFGFHSCKAFSSEGYNFFFKIE